MSASRMGTRSNRRTGDFKFKTDSEIGSNTRSSEKTLQRWADDDADTAPAAYLADMSLESTASTSKGWDQFAANKEMFGIVPTYDEHLYTTEINKAHPEYALREQRARQLAKEIEGQGHGGNVHLAEERGFVLDDSGLDEEDKYSGVARARQLQFQAFASGEAQNAMGSPSYLHDKEKQDRSSDAKKFSQKMKGNTEVPDLSGKQQSKANTHANAKPVKSAAAEGNTSKNDTANQKPKKKFNFAASAAKASSFKSSLSPSPRQSFSPVGIPSPTPAPQGIPTMPPMMAIPGAPPFGFPPPGMPGMGPPPPPPADMFTGTGFAFSNNTSQGSSARASIDSRNDSSGDLLSVKPLDGSFDYVENIKLKDEDIPKMYTTAPTWSSTSLVSYVDQFPAVASMVPRMPAFMPPVGFMYPPQF